MKFKLSCKEVSELVSRSLDEPLPWRQRLGVRLHHAYCRMCRRYAVQIRFLSHATRAWLHRQEKAGAGLSPEARARIREMLNSDHRPAPQPSGKVTPPASTK